MNKQEILKQYKNEDDKLLIAKVLDKLEYAISKNKITNTDFLDVRQKLLVEKLLNKIDIQNYIIYGALEEAERNVIIFYPTKLNKVMVEKNYNSIIHIIEIILPNELKGKYTHRDYLGGLMKLGIKREKVGDIVVWEKGAQAIVLNEIIPFLEQNISSLIRFQKSQICVKEISELHPCEIKKEEIEIIIPSMRLDNIVSELSKTSRAKAEEIIRGERVFVNYEVIIKDSKLVKIGDKITIRGKGKFEVLEHIGNTKKGNIILKVNKYV